MNQILLSDTLRQWQETATYWAKHHHTIRTMFAPLTAALIEQAGIIEGQSILDVAGGAGEPSLTIAEIVGPRGSITCTDPVAEMVAVAEREARGRGLRNVQFRQCAADSLPFPNDSFDAVVCRLGIMFFPDPLNGLQEMLRVTKPAGHVALAVWHKSELNPYSYRVTEVMSRHVKTAPADPNAPDAFRFAADGKLVSTLIEAGAVDVAERILKFDVAAPLSPEEFWAMRSEISETLREKLMNLSNQQRAKIASEVKAAVREFFPNNQMKFPAQMIIVTGTKPSFTETGCEK